MSLVRIEAYVREMIAHNNFWAARACLAIFARQTADEQRADQTKLSNGVGFTGPDAKFGSSVAKQLLERGFTAKSSPRNTRWVPLSREQISILREMMPKYAAQLAQLAASKPDFAVPDDWKRAEAA